MNRVTQYSHGTGGVASPGCLALLSSREALRTGGLKMGEKSGLVLDCDLEVAADDAAAAGGLGPGGKWGSVLIQLLQRWRVDWGQDAQHFSPNCMGASL